MPARINRNVVRKGFSEEKLDNILKVAENVRKMAELEAKQIIENAKDRAAALEKRVADVMSTANVSINGESHIPENGAEKNGYKEPGRGLFGISAKEVFRVILERERSRSDRNGHELSLVIFTIGKAKNERVVSSLTKVLKNRARAVDRFGWFNDDSIGIVLPNTNYKGGFVFARSVCEKIMVEKHMLPEFKVYAYPNQWFYRKRFPSQSGRNIEYVEGSDPIFARNIPGWKRALDIFGAAFALILSAPVFLIVPLIIKIVSPGSVFFKQERVGHGGRVFTFLKFRTMILKGDESQHKEYLSDLITTDKPMIKLDKSQDRRIIPLGKFIRSASIDEIPQLINVLKGDMSLVGPRPCLPYEAKEYLKWHKYRFDINPGMTGLWQVSGKNQLTFKEMIRLDILYMKRMRLGFDLWILLQTIPAIISMIIDKFRIDAFFRKVEMEAIQEEQFKSFIKRYYSDIFNVDKLEFLDDKLKKYRVNLLEVVLLLSKLHRFSPSYNPAKRYFGIVKLIENEGKSQLKNIK